MGMKSDDSLQLVEGVIAVVSLQDKIVYQIVTLNNCPFHVLRAKVMGSGLST